MAKKVLMISNGHEVSRNIAIQLAKHGCRPSLSIIVDYIRVSIEGAFPVDLIGIWTRHVEADSQDAFLAAVQKAWTCLDVLLN
ncbi:unnamed protein product [Brassica rapa]|uniref:Uncharacterized protein n=1 Tax=Brassica campestris TaxID=3711 RepID=A0A3P6A7W1_BRACM|nr:unnamed protein product [Brassica rapa]VDC81180.1 unnamed protein product [Brassica rapa]